MRSILRVVQKKYANLHIKCRSFWYRSIAHKDSGRFFVYGSIKVFSPHNLKVGNKSTINHGCILNARDELTVGDSVHISPGVIINTGGLDYSQIGDERSHM